jgi:hypothetical protein
MEGKDEENKAFGPERDPNGEQSTRAFAAGKALVGPRTQ